MLKRHKHNLKGHLRCATPSSERVYKTLADEETDRNANRDLNHAQAEGKAAVVLLHRAVVVPSETTSLGETRLRQHPSSAHDSGGPKKKRVIVTHRYKEEDTGNHRGKRSPTRPSRVDVAQQADDESPRCGRERALVGQEPGRSLVRRVRAAREDDHDGQPGAPEGLQIRERGAGRVQGHQEEHRPPGERLAVPRPVRVAVASSRDVAVRGIDKSKGPCETRLGRRIRRVVGGEHPVYDVGPKTTLDDAERVVVLVVHKKDGYVRTDRKTKALDKNRQVHKMMAYISRTEPHRIFREVSSSALITKELSHQYPRIVQKQGTDRL